MNYKGMQFLVAGLGRFGKNVALTLEELGCDVIAIDSDESVVQSLSQDLTYVVCGNPADEKNLKALGVDDVQVAIVSMADMQSSVLCTLLLKEFGVSKVVAKASSELHGKILEKIGADRIVYPEKEMARRLANNLYSDQLEDYVDIMDDMGIISIRVPSKMIGVKVLDTNFHEEYNVNISCIKRVGKNIVNPPAGEVLQEGDLLILFGKKQSLARVREHLA